MTEEYKGPECPFSGEFTLVLRVKTSFSSKKYAKWVCSIFKELQLNGEFFGFKNVDRYYCPDNDIRIPSPFDYCKQAELMYY